MNDLSRRSLVNLFFYFAYQFQTLYKIKDSLTERLYLDTASRFEQFLITKMFLTLTLVLYEIKEAMTQT